MKTSDLVKLKKTEELYEFSVDKRLNLYYQTFLLYKHPKESPGMWGYHKVKIVNSYQFLGHNLTIKIKFLNWKDRIRFFFKKKRYFDEEIENNFTKISSIEDWMQSNKVHWC